MNEFRIHTKLMGSAFELIVTAETSAEADRLLNIGIDEIKRIEELLSEFREHSDTTLINKNAGIKAVQVNDEVFSLLERCQQISAITQGAFDITVGPLKKLYNFKNREFVFPDKKSIRETLQRVGFQKIQLNKQNKEVYLTHPDMHISFAAIGKGYAADCVKKIWMQEGVTSGVISASGDLTTIGYRADSSPWQVGIANPDDKEEMLFFIPSTNTSIATSGDYEQFFIHSGVRYSHNINPITGMAIKGIKSVSIISGTAELSDALATGVYIMGIDVGLHFINQLPQTHCILIDDKNKTYYSKKINIGHELQAL